MMKKKKNHHATNIIIIIEFYSKSFVESLKVRLKSLCSLFGEAFYQSRQLIFIDGLVIKFTFRSSFLPNKAIFIDG